MHRITRDGGWSSVSWPQSATFLNFEVKLDTPTSNHQQLLLLKMNNLRSLHRCMWNVALAFTVYGVNMHGVLYWPFAVGLTVLPLRYSPNVLQQKLALLVGRFGQRREPAEGHEGEEAGVVHRVLVSETKRYRWASFQMIDFLVVDVTYLRHWMSLKQFSSCYDFTL